MVEFIMKGAVSFFLKLELHSWPRNETKLRHMLIDSIWLICIKSLTNALFPMSRKMSWQSREWWFLIATNDWKLPLPIWKEYWYVELYIEIWDSDVSLVD